MFHSSVEANNKQQQQEPGCEVTRSASSCTELPPDRNLRPGSPASHVTADNVAAALGGACGSCSSDHGTALGRRLQTARVLTVLFLPIFGVASYACVNLLSAVSLVGGVCGVCVCVCVSLEPRSGWLVFHYLATNKGHKVITLFLFFIVCDEFIYPAHNG